MIALLLSYEYHRRVGARHAGLLLAYRWPGGKVMLGKFAGRFGILVIATVLSYGTAGGRVAQFRDLQTTGVTSQHCDVLAPLGAIFTPSAICCQRSGTAIAAWKGAWPSAYGWSSCWPGHMACSVSVADQGRMLSEAAELAASLQPDGRNCSISPA